MQAGARKCQPVMYVPSPFYCFSAVAGVVRNVIFLMQQQQLHPSFPPFPSLASREFGPPFCYDRPEAK